VSRGFPDRPADGMLATPLPSVDDLEGERVPSGLPPIVDAHVHVFPDGLFDAIWGWFDTHGWPVRYRRPATELVEFLHSHGVGHIIALHYAHKPGVARELNRHLAGFCDVHPRVTGMATVMPGEPEATRILEEGFELGLRGVKLHAHVQCFDPEGEACRRVYEICEANDMPLVMHAGREPKSEAYGCDPHELCSADRVERILARHPRLRLCVPHLAADEFDTYRTMLEHHDNLWLDTAMAVADYLPGPAPPPLESYRADRVMYGTDFPNIPYAWDRELRRILAMELPTERLRPLLGGNAAGFFKLSLDNRRNDVEPDPDERVVGGSIRVADNCGV